MPHQRAGVGGRPHRHLELSPSILYGPLDVLAFPLMHGSRGADRAVTARWLQTR